MSRGSGHPAPPVSWPFPWSSLTKRVSRRGWWDGLGKGIHPRPVLLASFSPRKSSRPQSLSASRCLTPRPGPSHPQHPRLRHAQSAGGQPRQRPASRAQPRPGPAFGPGPRSVLGPPPGRPRLRPRPDRKKRRHPVLIGRGMGVPPPPSQLYVGWSPAAAAL